MSTAATTPAGSRSAPNPTAQTVVISSGKAWAYGGLLVVVFVAVFWDFFFKQARWAVNEPSDWGHTLVIPAIAGYFVYLMRGKLLAKPFEPSLWGAIPLLLGLGWYVACAFGVAALQNHNLNGFGVGICMLGVLIMIFGWRAMRYLWFPWAYWLVFGQTISESVLSRVTERLQDLSALGAALLLNNVLGIETDRVGNVLTVALPGGGTCPLNVAEACSGMRTLVAFMALGVAMAYIGLPRWWQRVALVIMGVPISLFVNILRVASLGVLGRFDVSLTGGNFHELVGLLWLLPAFLLFLGTMWVMRNMLVEVPAEADKKPAAKSPTSGGSHAV